MKQTNMINFTKESEQGLRSLRKDAGKLAKWTKHKYELRKLKKIMKRKQLVYGDLL